MGGDGRRRGVRTETVSDVTTLARAPDDADAFADWVRPALIPMARLAMRLAPHADADDVVQEALARAWRRRSTFDAARGTPTTWLLAIVADQARSARRTRLRHLRLVDEGAVVPDKPAPQQQADAELDDAIRRLPARQQLAVQVHYFVGMSVEETAAVMGCSGGTVKSTLYDARAKLRGLLGDTDD